MLLLLLLLLLWRKNFKSATVCVCDFVCVRNIAAMTTVEEAAGKGEPKSVVPAAAIETDKLESNESDNVG